MSATDFNNGNNSYEEDQGSSERAQSDRIQTELLGIIQEPAVFHGNGPYYSFRFSDKMNVVLVSFLHFLQSNVTLIYSVFR